MKKYTYLVVGGGVVAGYAAQEFVKHEQFNRGNLAIVTDDNTIPYERPPLSKEFLSGKEGYQDIQINAPQFYRDNGIDLFLYTRVNQINVTDKIVKTDHGDTFQYEKMLLATGSHAVELNIPGSDHPSIRYLRTVEDARTIRKQLNQSNDIVVVGGGYIGMEATAALTQDGHHVTMVFPEDRLMERFFTPQLSNFFETYYRNRGITFIKGETVERFTSIASGRVRATLSNHDELDAELVVVGVGAKPNLGIIKDSPIDTDDGVLVNSRLQTSIPDVYAAGDIVRFYDSVFDKHRRVEHWQNAVDMAHYASREMLGIAQDDFQSLRYFFSDIFDLSYEFWGDTEGANTVMHIGDFDEESMGVWWLKSSRVMAVFLMNRPAEERENAQRWIEEQHTINPEMFEESIYTLSE